MIKLSCPQYLTKKSAFTLIELLIALFVFAILVLAFVPNWQHIIAKNKALSDVNRIASMIRYAHYQAMTTGYVVTLCKSRDQQHCSGTWSDGQIVFIDKNANHQCDSDDKMIRVNPAVTKGASLTWHGFNSTFDDVQIQPSGINQAMNGRFVYTPADKKLHVIYEVIINRLGRVRLLVKGEKRHLSP